MAIGKMPRAAVFMSDEMVGRLLEEFKNDKVRWTEYRTTIPHCLPQARLGACLRFAQLSGARPELR
jgi:hypothetical protein